MTRAESLLRIYRASEIRHEGEWFRLAEESKGWVQVGGPYRTRHAARAARTKAIEEWRSMQSMFKYTVKMNGP